MKEWLATNTFDCNDFSDLSKLVKLKKKQRVKISVCIPTLNEHKTIARVVGIIKKRCIEQFCLVDEIVVMDDDSTDGTPELAEKAGAKVFFTSQCLPEEGFYLGKGESLWKSLYVLKGDIILWIDGDIKNMDPRFIYGLLGPLLIREEIGYVKGFYRRPITEGTRLHSVGGGRVTEILVRPLLNLFYPELSGVFQPLSGEYAGRRKILEKMPFFNGYGVETGLLIDIYKQFGLKSIAQVDLKMRVHHNQRLGALSKMSFEILQAFFKRAEAAGKIKILEELNKSLRLIRYHEKHYLTPKTIVEIERPPMTTIKKYRQKYGSDKKT